MRILITGAAGVLGSALAERFLSMGFSVSCMDVCRIDEAWRLAAARDRIEYSWKSSEDMTREDAGRADCIIDAGIGVADRPLGTSSPAHSLDANVRPPLRVLEAARRAPRPPVVVYPSSFNVLYGHPPGSGYAPGMLPSPSSVYGWTKAAAELLYLSYHRAHGVPCVITRVGSGYGARMRSDEFPAQLMLKVLRGRDVVVRSPGARRLWTYGEDIADFYARLVGDLRPHVGETLHCAGNAGGRIVENIELARMVAGMAGGGPSVSPGEYEPGELVGGRPVSFRADVQSPLWRPRFTLEEGMKRTMEWFRENLERYSPAPA